jgi:hypothetical protein
VIKIKQYRVVLVIFMTAETSSVNADDITHLQTLSKGRVFQLKRNASMRIFCELHKQNKRNVRVWLNLC